MMMREAIDDFGGRRFLLSFASLWVASSLLIGDFIDPTTYRDIVLGTVGAYILGNTWQKVKSENL
jgi:hypothetical protein